MTIATTEEGRGVYSLFVKNCTSCSHIYYIRLVRVIKNIVKKFVL